MAKIAVRITNIAVHDGAQITARALVAAFAKESTA
jgi:hypothetical protein